MASNASDPSLTVALSGTGTGSSSGGGSPTNLALNASVSASSYTQNYVPANAVDGNTSTYWEGTNGTWPTTYTANLGADDSLSSVVLDLPPSSAWGTRTQTLSVLGSTNGSSYSHPGRLGHLHLQPVHRQHGHDRAALGHPGISTWS